MGGPYTARATHRTAPGQVDNYPLSAPNWSHTDNNNLDEVLTVTQSWYHSAYRVEVLDQNGDVVAFYNPDGTVEYTEQEPEKPDEYTLVYLVNHDVDTQDYSPGNIGNYYSDAELDDLLTDPDRRDIADEDGVYTTVAYGSTTWKQNAKYAQEWVNNPSRYWATAVILNKDGEIVWRTWKDGAPNPDEPPGETHEEAEGEGPRDGESFPEYLARLRSREDIDLL